MSTKNVENTLFGGEEEKPLSDNEKKMNMYNEEAVKLSKADQHESALKNYERAISGSAEGDVLLPIFLSNRAHSLIALGKLDEAQADCARANKADPKCIMAYIVHSKVYAHKGKLGQALDLLRQALSKDKENKSLPQMIALIEGEQRLETAVAKSDPTRQRMNQYLDQLKAQGVESDSFKVRMIDQRTTVVLATKDIAKDEQVLFIPTDQMLPLEGAGDVPANSWMLWNPKIGEQVAKKEQMKVAMYYLHEKNNKKWKFKKYFDSLIQDNTNHVVRWNEADNEVLTASWLAPHIVQLQKQVEDDYNLIQKEIPAETRGEFTLDEYKQAWAFADTNFQTVKIGEHITHALVPILNYFGFNDDTSTTTQFNATKNGLQVIAARKIQRGEEICLRALSNSNDYSLMKKGFIHPRKPTRLPFQVTLAKEDPMYNAKKAAMNGKDTRVLQVFNNINDPQFMELIMFLRFFMMSGSPETFARMRAAEIQRKTKLGGKITAENAFNGTPVYSSSTKVEVQVWSMIAQLVQGRMKTYPVTIDVIRKALIAHESEEGPKLSTSQYAAHSYLLQEQQSLIGILQLASCFTNLLAMDFEALIKELSEKPFYQQWKDYIDSSIIGNKKAEFDLAKQLAAAKAGETDGLEAVKQLPAGANAGEGSLY